MLWPFSESSHQDILDEMVTIYWYVALPRSLLQKLSPNKYFLLSRDLASWTGAAMSLFLAADIRAFIQNNQMQYYACFAQIIEMLVFSFDRG